jgi:hypothetical protein
MNATRPADLPAPVAAAIAAANANDVDAFLASFTPDGETIVTAQVGGNGFNGPSHFSFRVAGDRVARMTIRA